MYGGFSEVLMPYAVVGTVAGTSVVASLLAAIAMTATSHAWLSALLLALPTWLSAWSVTGSISLIGETVFHAQQRYDLLRGADEAAKIRAARTRSRRSAPAPESRPPV
jgi:hypothetical protein